MYGVDRTKICEKASSQDSVKKRRDSHLSWMTWTELAAFQRELAKFLFICALMEDMSGAAHESKDGVRVCFEQNSSFIQLLVQLCT